MAAKSIQLSYPKTPSPFRAPLIQLLRTLTLSHGSLLFTWLLRPMITPQTQSMVTKAKTITGERRAPSIPYLTHTIVIVMYLNPEHQQCGQRPCTRTVICRLFPIVPYLFVLRQHQVVSSVPSRLRLRRSHIPFYHMCPSRRVLRVLLQVVMQVRVPVVREQKQLLWRTTKSGWKVIIGKNPRMQLGEVVYR